METAHLIDIRLIKIMEVAQLEVRFPLKRLTLIKDKIISQVDKE
jgi:hypothetical protein